MKITGVCVQIGLLANLQVMGGVSNAERCKYPIDAPGWPIEARDAMLVEPVEVDEKGRVVLPEAPGLGIALDEERVAAHGEEV